MTKANGSPPLKCLIRLSGIGSRSSRQARDRLRPSNILPSNSQMGSRRPCVLMSAHRLSNSTPSISGKRLASGWGFTTHPRRCGLGRARYARGRPGAFVTFPESPLDSMPAFWGVCNRKGLILLIRRTLERSRISGAPLRQGFALHRVRDTLLHGQVFPNNKPPWSNPPWHDPRLATSS